jgi:hypothetical protein
VADDGPALAQLRANRICTHFASPNADKGKLGP